MPKTKSDQKSEIEAAVFAAGSSSSGFFRRLRSLLYDILCAMPMIVCFGVPYFLLGCQNAALDQLMIKIGEFTPAFPRFMFYNWFAFFFTIGCLASSSRRPTWRIWIGRLASLRCLRFPGYRSRSRRRCLHFASFGCDR